MNSRIKSSKSKHSHAAVEYISQQLGYKCNAEAEFQEKSATSVLNAQQKNIDHKAMVLKKTDLCQFDSAHAVLEKAQNSAGSKKPAYESMVLYKSELKALDKQTDELLKQKEHLEQLASSLENWCEIEDWDEYFEPTIEFSDNYTSSTKYRGNSSDSLFTGFFLGIINWLLGDEIKEIEFRLKMIGKRRKFITKCLLYFRRNFDCRHELQKNLKLKFYNSIDDEDRDVNFSKMIEDINELTSIKNETRFSKYNRRAA